MTSTTGRRAALALLIAAMTGCASTSHGAASTVTPAPAKPAAQSSTTAAVLNATPHWTPADAEFMTGMIGHHAQAVLMAGWAPTHGAGQAVKGLCERIVVGQRDEIALMQRWLREWKQPVPEADASMDMMPGMEHMLMPGMLTADQLNQLNHATGSEFDQMFLAFMIRHHQGALIMVKKLIETPGGARDDAIFKFVSDMNADQTTEINRMNLMLAGIPTGATSP